MATTHIKEATKTTQISDAFGNLRYEVRFTTEHSILGLEEIVNYKIEVQECFFDPTGDPLINEYEKCYNKAIGFFDECVRKYTSLVNAEQRDFQDIEVYKTKIGYRLTCPKCCATCKWLTILKKQHNCTELKCKNPENIAEYSFDVNKNDIDCHLHYKHPSVEKLPIYPNVKEFGVCDRYYNKLLPPQ